MQAWLGINLRSVKFVAQEKNFSEEYFNLTGNIL